jgi:mycothiol synthase
MDIRLNLPEGLTARPAAAEEYKDAVTALIAACELADDGVVEVDRDDLVVSFGRAGFDLGVDALMVFDGQELVAWAEVYRGRAEADVRPSHRGRGVGAALLAWTEARARALGSADVGQTKTDANGDARKLFGAAGYTPTHTAWILRTTLGRAPHPPEIPEGISVRTYETDRDERDTYELMDAAFSEWPGRESQPFEVWASEVPAHPAFAPDLSWLAFDGGELVGIVLSCDYPDLGEGWIQQLATKATHRRRGVARALLRTAFVTFHERGRTIAGVSTDSRTGALGLYEQVGMHVERSYTRYTKDLGSI